MASSKRRDVPTRSFWQRRMNLSRKLNVDEAAAYVGLSASTLNKLRVFGGGPVFLKLGRRVAYDAADLDAWLALKRRRSTSDVGANG